MNRSSLALSLVAIFIALGGTVYAAQQIDGRTIRPGSEPGNRLRPHSVSADRLRPDVLRSLSVPLSAPADSDAPPERVPFAEHADTADSATNAQNAARAANAAALGGYTAGCAAGTVPFAGECWESEASAPVTAPEAAAACAARGGALPSTLALVSFGSSAPEWADDVTAVSGPGTYAVAAVAPGGIVEGVPASALRAYRCVLPLLK